MRVMLALGFGLPSSFGWRTRQCVPPGEFEKCMEPQSWPISVEVVPAMDELDLIIGEQVQHRRASWLEQGAVMAGDQEVHRDRALSNEGGQIPRMGAKQRRHPFHVELEAVLDRVLGVDERPRRILGQSRPTGGWRVGPGLFDHAHDSVGDVAQGARSGKAGWILRDNGRAIVGCESERGERDDRSQRVPDHQVHRSGHLTEDIGGQILNRQQLWTQPGAVTVAQQVEPVNLPTEICEVLSDTPPGQPAGLNAVQQHHRWLTSHSCSRSLMGRRPVT